jgi:sterol O-acyltransferase
MWMPVLVYDEQYPRKPTRDLVYIARKCSITLLGILASYIIHTDYVLMYIELGDRISFFELLCRCILPFLMIEVILFYVVFENITNVFAELTRFADRQFYDDWWNATTYE